MKRQSKAKVEAKVKAKALRFTRLPWLGEVQAARSRVAVARTRWASTHLGQSALNVEVQAHAHPLTCVGVAAGAGMMLGLFVNIGPGHAMTAARQLGKQAWPLVSGLMAMTRDAGEEE